MGKLSFSELGGGEIAVFAKDAFDNQTDKKNIGKFVVEPVGKVSDLSDGGGLAGAQIKVFVFSEESKSFVRWQSEAYGIDNPVEAGEGGIYSLLLPAGRYQLLIQRAGYLRTRSTEFILPKTQFVGFDFELRRREGFRGVLEDILEKINLF